MRRRMRSPEVVESIRTREISERQRIAAHRTNALRRYEGESNKLFMLYCLRREKGNVTGAARLSGISRRTFYNYIEDDKAFAAEFKFIRNELMDEVEYELFKLIKKGRFSAIKFFLEHRGQSRGYGKKSKSSDDENLVGALREDISDDDLVSILEETLSHLRSKEPRAN